MAAPGPGHAKTRWNPDFDAATDGHRTAGDRGKTKERRLQTDGNPPRREVDEAEAPEPQPVDFLQ